MLYCDSTTEMQTSIENLKLFVATWNMGNAEPEGFQALLFEREEKFDMYVIGLQESTYSIANKNASGDACIPHLINHLKTIMGSNYHMVRYINYCFCQYRVNTVKNVIHMKRIYSSSIDVFNLNFTAGALLSCAIAIVHFCRKSPHRQNHQY